MLNINFQVFLIFILVPIINSCTTIDQNIIDRHESIISFILDDPKVLYNKIQVSNNLYIPSLCKECVEEDVRALISLYPNKNYYRTRYFPFEKNGFCEYVCLKSPVKSDAFVFFRFCKSNRSDTIWQLEILFEASADPNNSID
ncbi:MAG: hypothetical protein K1X91_02985 [Bacteriodetes bacterium]|nr:hypothetical protein [Bacteroidota bacterium]